MKNELIKELKGLKKKLELMPKSKERELLFIEYYKYYNFLKDLRIIEDNNDPLEFNNDDDSVSEKTAYRQIYELTELLKNIPMINTIIEKMISYYHDNNFYAINNYKKTTINNDNIEDVLDDFFEGLSPDIKKLYNRLLDEEHIYFTTLHDAGGETYFRMFDKLSNIIVDGRGDSLFNYISLVHEVGHAYQKYLERNNTNFHNIHYGVEITSILFEKLFIKYLEDNHLFKDQVKLINIWELSSNLNTLAHCKLIGNLLKDDKMRISPFDLDVNSDLSIEEITNILENDCGYVFTDRKKLNLINYTYLLGDIISSYFYYKIIDNKKEGINELNNFITNIYNMPIDEFIDTYMIDTKYVKKYINEKIGEYHNNLTKKH